MDIQILIAIAQLCHFSISPAATGSSYTTYEPYNNAKEQLNCQKILISCVKTKKKLNGAALADCVLAFEWSKK
jgi:hypothetical protein